MEEVIRKTGIKLMQVGELLGIHNLDPESGLVFVTGGTGPIGYRVATRLLRAGYPQVRLGVLQHSSAIASLNEQGAEIADFSWENEDTYEKALSGVKSVLCTIPYTKEWKMHFPAFVHACQRAGVKHFVKLSFYHARVSGDMFQQVPLVRAHGDCDDMLISSVARVDNEMGYTILYATHFMSNIFVFQGKELREGSVPNMFFGASGNHKVNYVSPNDIAEVAVRVLLEPRAHFNKEYTLTGPEAITDQTVAALLSKHLKKPVMYVDQPLHEFKTEIEMGGDPAWMVKDLVSLEKIKASGTEEADTFPTGDIELICGRKAETFEEYLQMSDMMTAIEAGAPGELKPLKETMDQ